MRVVPLQVHPPPLSSTYTENGRRTKVDTFGDSLNRRILNSRDIGKHANNNFTFHVKRYCSKTRALSDDHHLRKPRNTLKFNWRRDAATTKTKRVRSPTQNGTGDDRYENEPESHAKRTYLWSFLGQTHAYSRQRTISILQQS